MTNLMRLLFVALLAGSFTLIGCGSDDEHGHGHGHGEHGHSEGDGHDQGNTGGGHDHGDMHALGDLEIAGSVFAIAHGGEVAPNAALPIDIELKSGHAPGKIRVWVGDESATGVTKEIANGSKGDYHADVKCPAVIDDTTALWIQVESADGTRTAKPLPFEAHDD